MASELDKSLVSPDILVKGGSSKAQVPVLGKLALGTGVPKEDARKAQEVLARMSLSEVAEFLVSRDRPIAED